MSDIMELLRSDPDYDYRDDAADEIARLRLQCSQWEITVNLRDAEIKRLRTEIERLTTTKQTNHST